MGKLLHNQKAKLADPRPVDRAQIRKHDYSKLQNEIKAEALEKDKRYNRNVFGMDTSNRDLEVSATRAKNNFSSLSFLPGGQQAQNRLSQEIQVNRQSSRKVEQLQASFGGGQPLLKQDERPIMHRNKSFVEIGDRKSQFNVDQFRKQSIDRQILQSATAQQTIVSKHEDHAMRQQRSQGARVALNASRFNRDAPWTPTAAKPVESRRGSQLHNGIVRQTSTTFLSLA